MKATFELSSELYRAIKVEAARSDRAVKDVVEEALERWLEAAEDAEDVAAAREALAEYDRDGGGVEAGEFFRTLAAETKETYGAGGK